MNPVSPSVGLGVLHLFCIRQPGADADAVVHAVATAEATGVRVVCVALLGHKASFGFMALGDDLWKVLWIPPAMPW